MKIKVGINGMGRIGRMIVRSIFENNIDNIQIKHINNRTNSEFAQTIKLVVRDQIKDGKTEKEIYVFLIEKYGEWIVYKPPLNRANFLLWLLPYLVFIAGGVIIFLLFKKRDNRQPKGVYTYEIFNCIF